MFPFTVTRLPGFVLVSGFLMGAWAQPACPAWEDVHSKTVEIGPTDNLVNTAQSAASGTTILLQSGTYKISAIVQLAKDNVTLRSKSGNREDVILDGNGGAASPLDPSQFVQEVIAVSGSNVTIADISIRHAKYHGVHAYPLDSHGISGLHLRNLHVYDCSEQQIKVNSNGSNPLSWVDSGLVECSLVEFQDNSVMEDQGTYFYTGGIDVHGGMDWIVRDNVFRNIQRNAELTEAAVHFWSKSRGTLVENNSFIDNYRAITFGMQTSPNAEERKYPDSAGNNPYIDHLGGIIRNNMIFNHKGVHLESGMELTNVTGTEVYHNTVYSGDNPFSGIEYRFSTTQVTLKNNLVGYNILQRDSAQATLQGNLSGAPASLFVNAVTGDLHLASTASQAIDQGVALPAGKADYDFDGQLRNTKPDIGADEFSNSNAVWRLKKNRSAPIPFRPMLWEGRTLSGRWISD